jgi:hypothetical protein
VTDPHARTIGRGIAIEDPDVRRRAGELGRSAMPEREAAVEPIEVDITEHIRAAISLPRDEPWRAREALGAAHADAMRAMAIDRLPSIPAWLARRHGVTEAAKTLWPIVAARPGCTAEEVFASFMIVDDSWPAYLAELAAANLVTCGEGGRLRAMGGKS